MQILPPYCALKAADSAQTAAISPKELGTRKIQQSSQPFTMAALNSARRSWSKARSSMSYLGYSKGPDLHFNPDMRGAGAGPDAGAPASQDRRRDWHRTNPTIGA